MNPVPREWIDGHLAWHGRRGKVASSECMLCLSLGAIEPPQGMRYDPWFGKLVPVSFTESDTSGGVPGE